MHHPVCRGGGIIGWKELLIDSYLEEAFRICGGYSSVSLSLTIHCC